MEYGEEPRSVADKGAGLKANRNYHNAFNTAYTTSPMPMEP